MSPEVLTEEKRDLIFVRRPLTLRFMVTYGKFDFVNKT